MRYGGVIISELMPSGIRIIDRVLGGFPIPSTILVVSDPIASPELILYNFSNGGYYFASVKSPKIIETEMRDLGFNSKIIRIDERNILNEIDDISNCKAVVEFTFDENIALKLREIAMKNKILLLLSVLKNWYNDKSLTLLQYLCDGVFIIESERVGDRFVYKFSIPKMLGGVNMPTFIRFKTKKKILEIDTSREVS